MPAGVVRKVVKVCDFTTEEVETKWKEAKALAKEQAKEGDDQFYAITMAIFKNMLPKWCHAKLGWKSKSEARRVIEMLD